jgi:hypothetical protein
MLSNLIAVPFYLDQAPPVNAEIFAKAAYVCYIYKKDL